MSLLRRTTTEARPGTVDVADVPPRSDDEASTAAALRDQPDLDPLVEQAADRLRTALTTLEARDEWGRELAWRQVARIAIGPLLTELRDLQTASRLSAATVGNGWPSQH